jgi:putative SOS response-associated peptidase YedK
MCGRFTQRYSWRQVHAYLRHWTVITPDEPVSVTPMRFATLLHRDAKGGLAMAPMRWGFADRNAANPARPKHMHVRAETIDARAAFAESFIARRALIYVENFNEGEEVGKKTVQYVISPNDQQPIAIAAIYEEWRNGPLSLHTFVMVTTEPNPLIARITDRMPAVLAGDDQQTWLEGAPIEAKITLRPYDDGGAWTMAPQSPLQRKLTPDLFAPTR